MSVIGRLDKQVDEILFSPLDRNRRRTPQTQPTAQAATPEQAEPPLHKAAGSSGRDSISPLISLLQPAIPERCQ
jgi:hypothetical protein